MGFIFGSVLGGVYTGTLAGVNSLSLNYHLFMETCRIFNFLAAINCCVIYSYCDTENDTPA